jgi:hypothetical protein
MQVVADVHIGIDEVNSRKSVAPARLRVGVTLNTTCAAVCCATLSSKTADVKPICVSMLNPLFSCRGVESEVETTSNLTGKTEFRISLRPPTHVNVSA